MYERHHLELTRASFPIAGLPEALRGLRVGFLSDIHRSQTVSHEAVAAAVQMVMAERPDLIVLGGDYVTWSDARFVGPAADALAPLRAPLGVIAVLGNHDDDRDMPAALAAKGFTVLRDARTRVTVRGEALDFVGIRYWTYRLPDIARLLRGALPHAILLAHTPKRLSKRSSSRSPPSSAATRTAGRSCCLDRRRGGARVPRHRRHAQREGTSIFVSRGVGTVYVPVRINCPPEVAVLTLETAHARLTVPRDQTYGDCRARTADLRSPSPSSTRLTASG